jgi:hypothetical protein
MKDSVTKFDRSKSPTVRNRVVFPDGIFPRKAGGGIFLFTSNEVNDVQ